MKLNRCGCGGEAELRDNTQDVYVVCAKCHITTPGFVYGLADSYDLAKQQVSERWNRANPTRKVWTVEELKRDFQMLPFEDYDQTSFADIFDYEGSDRQFQTLCNYLNERR